MVLPSKTNLLNLQFAVVNDANTTFNLRQFSSDSADTNKFTLTLTCEPYTLPAPTDFRCTGLDENNTGYNPTFTWAAPTFLDVTSAYKYELSFTWLDAAATPQSHTKTFELDAGTSQYQPTYPQLHVDETRKVGERYSVDMNTGITVSLVLKYYYTINGQEGSLSTGAGNVWPWVYFTNLQQIPATELSLNGIFASENKAYQGELCELKWTGVAFEDKNYDGAQTDQIYYQTFFGKNAEGTSTNSTALSLDRGIMKKYRTETPIRVIAFIKTTDTDAAVYNVDLPAINFTYVNSSRIYYYDNGWKQAEIIYYYTGEQWLEAYDISYYDTQWSTCKHKAGE